MAHNKKGLDYYSHATNMTDSDGLVDVRMEYGCTGIAVWFALLDIIYEHEGYFLRYDESTLNRTIVQVINKVSGKDTPDRKLIIDIIEFMAEVGLFDIQLYHQGYLTSRDIQMQYFMATTRRKNVEVDRSIWLLSVNELKKEDDKHSIIKCLEDDVDIIAQNVNMTEENVDILEQSKVKKSKEKKSRVKEKKAEESKAAPAREEYGDSDMLPPDIGYIPPPADEYFPEVDVPEEAFLAEDVPEVNVPEEYDFSLDEIAERNPALARSLSNMTIVMPDGSEVSARDYQPQGDNEVRREAARQREREARQAEREAQQHSQEQERRQKEQEALNTALTLSAMKGNIPDISERLWAICDSASQAAGEFERKHGSWEQVEAQREAQRIASGEVTLVTLTAPPSTPERDALVKCYGEYNVARYEQKFRSWAERSRRDASEMYPRITKWMAEDLGRK